jgi:hypothetical protein
MAGLSRWGTWVAAASEERRQDDHMENWIWSSKGAVLSVYHQTILCEIDGGCCGLLPDFSQCRRAGCRCKTKSPLRTSNDARGG